MDFKDLGKNHPGMWRFRKNREDCCVYRVPDCIRRVNPEAYTPQLVIIGPLHHSLKTQALVSLGDITDTKSMGYINMEEHKKIYLREFARKVEAEINIDGFRRIIKENEDSIRESYSESTAWIKSREFVDMILHDSVFILEFILRSSCKGSDETGDPLMVQQLLQNTVRGDLILLENQLPYFILEKLFDPIMHIFYRNKTFRKLIITYFRLEETMIRDNSKFKHFTDLIRCVRVETLPEGFRKPFNEHMLHHMYNVDMLHSGGVKFEAVNEVVNDTFSLHVRFENGCLKIPTLVVDDVAEITLRNIMALEQCHYPNATYVCSHILFLDFLIDTDRDVYLLVEKGIIKNYIGHHSLVAEMVNKLGLGTLSICSYYSDIAVQVKAHYSNPIHKSLYVLKRVYFGNLWTGTATIAATFLLVMTLIQTIASILQVKQKAP